MAKKKNITLPEYAKANNLSQAEVMVMARKEKQRKNPAAFALHSVRINSKGKLFLIPPNLIGAFE